MTQRHSGMPAGLSEDRLDRIKRVFKDVRRTLGVCWVGELFELLAVYDLYLQAAWLQLKPSVASAYFERTAHELQSRAGRAVYEAGFPFSDHRRLVGGVESESGSRPLAGGEKLALATTLDLLERINAVSLLIATAARDALLGREVGASPPRTGPDAALRPEPAPISVRLRWAEGLAADVSGPPDGGFASREYLLLAAWGDYFETVRRELRPLLRAQAYAQAAAQLDVYATAAVRALPYPFRASGELARSLGYAAADVNDLLAGVTEAQKRLCELALQTAALRLGWTGGNMG
ncbi:MAG TPA: hypothetical protein VKV26_17610 [Dehalococcoidia bacterium]|nr:hypothetical protein [Dehalococcoidia bacterium]